MTTVDFFEDSEDVDLYSVLGLTKTPAPLEANIKRAYRTLALKHHPDKLTGQDEETQKNGTKLFQQIGFAYAVLSDVGRRKRYDETGRTDDAAWEEDGFSWADYFDTQFQRVSKDKLDALKLEYQSWYMFISTPKLEINLRPSAPDSDEELQDLRNAYDKYSGNLQKILDAILFADYTEEDRLIARLNNIISKEGLVVHSRWIKDINDKKAKARRKKLCMMEEQEAKQAMGEDTTGFWTDGKDAPTSDAPSGTESLSSLIKRRGEQSHNSMIASLVSKYGPKSAGIKSKGKSKAKGSGESAEVTVSSEPDEAEFEAIQQRLFGDNDKEGSKRSSVSRNSSMSKRAKRGQ